MMNNDMLHGRIVELRTALRKISETRFGWDGDCGVTSIADNAISADEQAEAATPERSGKLADAGEVIEAHARLSHHCVALFNRGEPMSLVERIDELYSWYAAIVNDTDVTEADSSSAAPSERPPAPAGVAYLPVGLDVCPISGRKFWGNIDHPELGYVATYGGPFDTYTIPVRGEDDELRSEHFCQDRGDWVEGGAPVGYFYNDQQPEITAPAPTGESLSAAARRYLACADGNIDEPRDTWTTSALTEYDRARSGLQKALATPRQTEDGASPYLWFHEESRTIHQTEMPHGFLSKCTPLYLRPAASQTEDGGLSDDLANAARELRKMASHNSNNVGSLYASVSRDLLCSIAADIERHLAPKEPAAHGGVPEAVAPAFDHYLGGRFIRRITAPAGLIMTYGVSTDHVILAAKVASPTRDQP